MNYDRAFVVTVLAAAAWFIWNPDYKSRTASADRLSEAPLPSANKVSETRSRVLYENVLIQIGPNDVGGCYANVVDSPVPNGTKITPPALDCRETISVRGSAIYDPEKTMFTEFEPNVAVGDFPYDRRVVARWKNYGALCPAGECSSSSLVFLDDGSIRVRGTSSGPGTIAAPDLKKLRETFASIVAVLPIERRIDDPKSSETVEIELVPEFVAINFIRADFLHASVRFPPLPETAIACEILASKTPTRFCALLGSELAPNASPSPLATTGPNGGTNGTGGIPSPFSTPATTPTPTRTSPPLGHPGSPNGPGTPAIPPSPPTPTSSGSSSTSTDPHPANDSPVKTSAHALTWGVMNTSGMPSGFVHLSCHGTSPKCDAYGGDTPCTSVLPLLCIRKDPSIEKPVFPAELNNVYSSWAAGEAKVVENVSGTRLTSVREADRICSETHGIGWRMAEFHDGWGWGFTAKGNLSPGLRAWIRINDQPANCWNSAR